MGGSPERNLCTPVAEWGKYKSKLHKQWVHIIAYL